MSIMSTGCGQRPVDQKAVQSDAQSKIKQIASDPKLSPAQKAAYIDQVSNIAHLPKQSTP